MFLGDAYAWATPSTLATLSLGDAFFLGDTFFLATPSSWRRLLLGDACIWRCLSLPRTGKR